MFIAGVFWGVLGLIFGSFCNVLVLRYGVASVGGRSKCPHCGRTLEWFELVPLVSWIALMGKCRTCKGVISIQYPVVEFLMGAAFLAIGLSGVPLHIMLLGASFIFFSIAIAAYDFRHTLMPDAWVYTSIALAFVLGLAMLKSGSIAYFLAAGPVVAFPLFALWFVSKGAWMGFGDVKCALGIGWLLGIVSGYLALAFAFCAGALVGVSLIAYGRMKDVNAITPTLSSQKHPEGFTMKSEVPFGPFLIFGVCIVWFSALYHLPLIPYLGDFLSLS